MNGRRRIRSWPEIVVIAFAISIGLLLAKFLLRPLLFGSRVIKGDEFADTVIWFAFLMIALSLQRTAATSWNLKMEINEDNDSSAS